MNTPYFKAVDSEGFSFSPFIKADRINWIDNIGKRFELDGEQEWVDAVEKLRKGETTVCTKHLIHGYADVALAIDFGERRASERTDKTFRIIEFTGEPVAQLEGAMLLNTMEWNTERKERFVNAVKYGFRSIDVTREVEV